MSDQKILLHFDTLLTWSQESLLNLPVLSPMSTKTTCVVAVPNLILLSFILAHNLGLMRIQKSEASMTGGLVQQYDHAVLPSVTPTVTIVLSVLTMLPALVKLWHLCADRRYRVMSFIRYVVYLTTAVFSENSLLKLCRPKFGYGMQVH